MNDDEQLREAFQSHEHLAPDAVQVHSRVLDLAHGYRRRRWAARAAGGAVVTAGLATAAVTVPGLLPGDRPTSQQTNLFAAAPPAPSEPAPSATPPALPPEQQQRDAFFAAGYDYDDAVELARVWGLVDSSGGADKTAAKADAGRRLMQGETLPLAPGAAPAAPSPAGAAGVEQDERPYDAFLDAGYDWDDAVTLARLWQSSDVLQVKAEAGRKLLAGETLPFPP